MVLGFERINERVRHPNKFINFIKPMEGPDRAIAQDYLERVAAIVFPIMRDNHLSVMSLEEHEPNKEFWGRNFNFGEIIQLVLKGHNGMWLPMHHVQMVMIHELAHVKEMNHGRHFHRFRISMQHELEHLKAKGYTGEGFWAPGRSVHPSASAVRENRPLFESEIPLDLCGGFYQRSGGRRRRRRQGDNEEKEKITYAERKRRRIVKKFGSEEGTSLGSDVEKRAQLDNSAYGGLGSSKPTKASMTKPRVAQSNRGRELRLQAALARLGPSDSADDAKQESKPMGRYLADTKEGIKREGNIKQQNPDMSDVIDIDDDETEDDYENEQGEITYVKAESDTEDEDKDELEKEFSELSCQPPRPREFRGKPIISLNDNDDEDKEEGEDEDVLVVESAGKKPLNKGKRKAHVRVEPESEASSPDTLTGDEPPRPMKRRRASVVSIDDPPDDDLDIVEVDGADDDLDIVEVGGVDDDLHIVDDAPGDDMDVIETIPGSFPRQKSIISIGDDTEPDDSLEVYETAPPAKKNAPETRTVEATTPKKKSINSRAGATNQKDHIENGKGSSVTHSQSQQPAAKPPSTPTTSTKTIDPISLKSPPGAPRSSSNLFGTMSLPGSFPSGSSSIVPTTTTTATQPSQPSSASVRPPPSSFSMNRVPSPPVPELICEVCSTPNDPTSTLCLVCSNVINTTLPYWKCHSVICREGDGKYKNSEDCGVCGVCGERRP